MRRTRIRLTRKLADVLDGVDVSRFNVGDELDLSPHDASLLIEEGWATACDEPKPFLPLPRSAGAGACWIQRFHSILETLAPDPAVTAAIVAQHMNLSPWHFSRLLRQRTHVRFRMHLSRTRLVIAARLLRESTLSIKEVSAHAGFTSASELNHQFRRTFRMTPTHYRTLTDTAFQQPADSQSPASISKNYQAS